MTIYIKDYSKSFSYMQSKDSSYTKLICEDDDYAQDGLLLNLNVGDRVIVKGEEYVVDIKQYGTDNTLTLYVRPSADYASEQLDHLIHLKGDLIYG